MLVTAVAAVLAGLGVVSFDVYENWPQALMIGLGMGCIAVFLVTSPNRRG